jgi:hypothetical protein
LYCHECGTKNESSTAVCIKCGTKLIQHDGVDLLHQLGFGKDTSQLESAKSALEVATGLSNDDLELNQENIQYGQNSHNSKNSQISRRPSSTQNNKAKPKAIAWLIPLIVLGVTIVSLIMYYKYEMGINEQVSKWHVKANEKALMGHYQEAKQLIDTALTERPQNKALISDQNILIEAMSLQEQLEEAANELKTQKMDSGEKLLDKVTAGLKEKNEPIFTPLHKELATNQTTLAVLKVKAEIETLDSVDALVEKLDEINKIEGKEAEAIAKQIKNKLVDVSYKAAEVKLKKSDFPKALQIVDYGLYHVPNSNKLSDYRKYIVEKREMFEQAEAKRIELAEQKAAEEALNNQTSAVQVIDINAVLDEYGDLKITGKIKNVATRPIYDVELTIDIYDLDGNYMNQVNAYVDPYYLDTNAVGSFTTTYNSAYAEASVTASHATWFLD